MTKTNDINKAIEELDELNDSRTQGAVVVDTPFREGDDTIMISIADKGSEYDLLYATGAMMREDERWEVQWNNAKFLAKAPDMYQIIKQQQARIEELEAGGEWLEYPQEVPVKGRAILSIITDCENWVVEDVDWDGVEISERCGKAHERRPFLWKYREFFPTPPKTNTKGD